MSIGGYTTAGAPQQAAGALGHTAVTAGGQPAMQGQGGGLQLGALNIDPIYAFKLMENSPEFAGQILRLAAGQQGRTLGKLGQFRDSLYGRAFQAYLSANGTGQPGRGPGLSADLSGFVNAANGQGGDIMSLIQGRANQIGQTDMSGMTDQDVEKNLRTQVALQSLLMGSLGANGMDNNLENLLHQNTSNQIQSSGWTGSLGAILADSPYQRAMQLYAQQR